jgi:hypothetical protein
MYSGTELIILTRHYLAATGIAAATLSRRVTGHTKLFGRLLDGYDCTMRTAEAASIWFDLYWPFDLPWPRDIRPRGSALAAVQPRLVPLRTMPLAADWMSGHHVHDHQEDDRLVAAAD